MEERKIGTDGACFLVKDVSLKQEWDCPIYAWLRERGFRSAPKGIDFAGGANIKNGMASLRSAAKKYFEFCASK